MLPSITVQLSGAQLSDLFFNANHPRYDEYFEAQQANPDLVNREQYEAAVYEDAREFVNNYLNGDEKLARALGADFMSRL